MSNYEKENRGAIWGNRDKKTDKHPDFTGNMNVDGVEYYVSAWKKAEDASPKAPSLKFSFKRKDAVDQQGMQQVKDAANHGGKTVKDFPDLPDPFKDDSIPF